MRPACVQFVREVLALLQELRDPDQEVEPVEVRDHGHQGHAQELEVEAAVKVVADHHDAHDGGDEGRHPGGEQHRGSLVDDADQGSEVGGEEGERDDDSGQRVQATEDKELSLLSSWWELDHTDDKVDGPDEGQEERHDLGGEEGLGEHPEHPGHHHLVQPSATHSLSENGKIIRLVENMSSVLEEAKPVTTNSISIKTCFIRSW